MEVLLASPCYVTIKSEKWRATDIKYTSDCEPTKFALRTFRARKMMKNWYPVDESRQICELWFVYTEKK